MNKLFYYSTFKDVDGNSFRIEIYKDSEIEVSSTELLLSGDTAQIECESESLFTPVKVSSLSVNALTKNVLADLYTAKANEISVKVYKNSVLFWFGYLSPNVYSSDYINETNLLSLEFVDTLSQLDYFKYKYIQDNTSHIQTFYSIITSILDRIDPEKIINEIYLSNSVQVDGENDVLRKMMIQERNFFDEANEADTCKGVLYEIIKYLSMSMIQYENKYLILDYDAIKNGNDKYVKYNRTTATTELTTLAINEIDINKHIYGANATISLGEVYNKIVVIGNNNPISNIIPDLLEDKDLENQNIDKNKVWEENRTIDDIEYKMLFAFFNSKENWKTLTPIIFNPSENSAEITPDTLEKMLTGAFFIRTDSYKIKDGEPSGLSWKTYLSFIGSAYMKGNEVYLSLKKDTLCIFKDGYFILDMKYYLSVNKQANTVLKENDELYYEDKYKSFEHSKFPCRLIIGDFYFDGDKWESHLEYNLKVERGYYKELEGVGTFYNAKWFYYIDQFGYKRFISENEYISLSTTLTKESGGYDNPNRIYFFTNEKNEKVFVTEEYYNECILRDCFYLVHKNKVDDKVFGTLKSLTNTVSYKYNLAESSDGVAIKLPSDNILSGKLTFELLKPSDLGSIPMDVAYCSAIHITDLSLIYTTDKYTIDIFSKEKYDADIKFENVVNEDFVNDFDDVKLRVNTYSEKAGSYSYVIKKVGDKYDYIASTLNLNTKDLQKQEEHIITKYYGYFSYPKYIYSNTLENVSVKPYSLLFENTLEKNFFLNKWVMNLGDNSIEVTANEV